MITYYKKIVLNHGRSKYLNSRDLVYNFLINEIYSNFDWKNENFFINNNIYCFEAEMEEKYWRYLSKFDLSNV